MNSVLRTLLIIAFAGVCFPGLAAVYELPENGDTVVGEMRAVRVAGENTLLDVARHYGLGYHEITLPNPEVDVWLPQSAERVLVATQFILPPKPWRGVVINIPQRRLFYFPEPEAGESRRVHTFPVGIARDGWQTPLGHSTIKNRHRDPGWMVPKSIRAEYFEEYGAELPEYFPPGPDNPMGMLAVETRFPGIFIHGTNRPWGVGMRVSHGCLHLYPEDARRFFDVIHPDTPLRIINEPVLIGSRGETTYIATYPTVTEYGQNAHAPSLSRALLDFVATHPAPGNPRQPLDWERIEQFEIALHHAETAPLAVPIPVSQNSSPLAQSLQRLPLEHYLMEPYDEDANDARIPQRHRAESAPLSIEDDARQRVDGV